MLNWLTQAGKGRSGSSQDSLTCALTHVDTIIINLTITHRQCCGAMRDRRRVQLRVIFHRGVNVSFRVEPGGFSGFLAARLDPPGDWRPAFLLTFCKSSTVKPTRSTRSQARVKEYGANGSEGCSYIPIMVLCGGKTGWLAANNKGYLL